MMATYYPHVSGLKDNFKRAYSGGQEQNLHSEPSSHFRNSTNYMNQTSDAGPYAEIFPGTSSQNETFHEILLDRSRNEMVFIPPASDTMHLQYIEEHLITEAVNPVGNSLVTSRTWVDIPDCKPNFQCHGLALSLGTQMQSAIPSLQYQCKNMVFPSSLSDRGRVLEKWTLSCEGAENNPSKGLRNLEFLSGFGGGNHRSVKGEVPHNRQCLMSHIGVSHVNLNELAGYPNNIFSSKYLKAIQQLLDEFVNVKRPVKRPESRKGLDDMKETNGRINNLPNLPTSISMSSEPSNSVNSSSELSPVERQDLQEKKKKLLLMLDEVDGRFKQYFSQTQILVSSFDSLTGQGAAKSYTELSLQTISSYFRCLHDAISGQMEVTRRRLGEQDTSNIGQKGIPRLCYMDHCLRQQRAVQQLGVMWHAWKPRRGLPESSVSVLRAWLFEHFLHPYPNDSEKIILARQTGLTRGQLLDKFLVMLRKRCKNSTSSPIDPAPYAMIASSSFDQVANWFINARVRLWKPMVEQMYKEEFGYLEANSKSSVDDATKAYGENDLASGNRLDKLQESMTSTAVDVQHPSYAKSNLIPNSELDEHVKTMRQVGPCRKNITQQELMKLRLDRNSNIADPTLGSDGNNQHNRNGNRNLMSAAVAYDIPELKGFTLGNQVSLALGLQHHAPGVSHTRSNSMITSPAGPDAVDHHFLNVGMQRDRFGNSHLLHDFVV